jgi:hypothetical protein
MKTLFTILFLAACVTVQAQGFANTNTKSIQGALPTVLYNADGSTTVNPTTWMLSGAGWLTVGYTQPASNGYAMLGSYAVTPTSNGFCSLLITGQYNLRAVQIQAWTNSTSWSAISSEAHIYSNLVWKYSPAHYTASLSNYVTTPATICQFYATNAAAWATPSNVLEFFQASSILSDLINFAGNSTNFPWEVVR